MTIPWISPARIIWLPMLLTPIFASSSPGDFAAKSGLVDSLQRGFLEVPGMALTGVRRASAAWGDSDNDGDLDILLAGDSGGGSGVSEIWRNNGDATFSHVATLTGIFDSDLAWGDYDNDGDLDILLAGDSGGGSGVSEIWRNNGSNSFSMAVSLPGIVDGTTDWVDYDNDGDLDVFLSGMLMGGGGLQISRIYRNNGSDSFTNSVSMLGIQGSSSAWGDYDNDGDFDLVTTGVNSGYIYSNLYRNDGADVFTTISVALTDVYYGESQWGDYDNDGDLDILLVGEVIGGKAGEIWRNDGSDAFSAAVSLTGIGYGDARWGDYDNDGDLDILLAGESSSGSGVTEIWRNDGPSGFSQDPVGLPGIEFATVAWGDYDNDGDLDILLAGDTGGGYIASIYQNGAAVSNMCPTVPQNLSAVVVDSQAMLSWSPSTDTETAQGALTYNIRIGSSPAGIDILSPMADAGTGFRLIPVLGNTNHDTSWVIAELAGGDYFWSVQAIDNAFAGSGFAVEGTFSYGPSVTTADVTNITSVSAACGGVVTSEGGFPVTDRGVVWGCSIDPTAESNTGMTHDGTGLGSFVSEITQLISRETYYVRAYATNEVSTSYGENRIFVGGVAPPGNGINFDGIQQFIEIPHHAQLNLAATYTLETWFRADAFTWLDGLISKYQSTASNGYLLRLAAEAPYTGFNFDEMYTSTGLLESGRWYHVAAVSNGGTRKLYLNGEEQGLSGTPITVQPNSDPLRFGVDYAERFLGGAMDEIRIWNIARSENEIRLNMNRLLSGDETGLVAYYRLDHATGSLAADETSNGHDGTCINMSGTGWATSAAAIGHRSHLGIGTGNLWENGDVPVDIVWDVGGDPGTEAIFAAIQVDDVPFVTTGLPVSYHSDTYWELWIAHHDGSWQADATFHYDGLGGIWDEPGLALYTRTAAGQNWTLMSGTSRNYEGNTSDGIGSITAHDLTGFSQFIICGGHEMMLSGSILMDTLVLQWNTVSPASAYWVYGAFNNTYFDPQLESPFECRQAVTADTIWSSPAGIMDPDTNWTYQVIAVDGSENELVRSNRVGEHDFQLP